MHRTIRSIFTLTALMVGLILIPAVALSAAGNGERGQFSKEAQTVPGPTATTGGTIPPVATATPKPWTPKPPKPKPTHIVYKPKPYPTPVRVMPTATPVTPDSALRLGGYWVERVIGDRFSDVIYAYANDWLYRSENDGNTWTLITSTPAVDDFIMNAFDPTVLYSGNGNSCDSNEAPQPMLKSTNGGIDWIVLPGSEGLRPLLSHAFDSETLFAADCQWLYLSNDGGSTWTASPTLAPNGIWANYTVENAAAVYSDAATAGNVIGWNWIYAGAKTAEGNGVVAFTTDEGATWQQITPNVDPSPWDFTALAVDPFIMGRIWFASPQGVWASLDNGQTWQAFSSGLDSTLLSTGAAAEDDAAGEAGLTAVVLHPNEDLYLGTARGLYVKAVGENQWTKITGTAFDDTTINRILFTESNPDVLYLNTTEGVHLVQIQ